MDIITDEEAIELSEIFKALSDPTRLKIIYLLLKEDLRVTDISEKLLLSQSAVSHQLRTLRNLRLVKYVKKGREVIYSLDDDHVSTLFKQGLEHISHR